MQHSMLENALALKKIINLEKKGCTSCPGPTKKTSDQPSITARLNLESTPHYQCNQTQHAYVDSVLASGLTADDERTIFEWLCFHHGSSSPGCSAFLRTTFSGGAALQAECSHHLTTRKVQAETHLSHWTSCQLWSAPLGQLRPSPAGLDQLSLHQLSPGQSPAMSHVEAEELAWLAKLIFLLHCSGRCAA